MESDTTEPSCGTITALLRSHQAGDREAFDRLMPLVYDQLCAVARRQLRRGHLAHSMDTSALVRETYLQLIDASGVAWEDRGHFLAICARTMRRVMVDAARRRMASKRNGGETPASIDPDSVCCEPQDELMLNIDQVLESLGRFNARLMQVVECRFFAGMSEAETALALNTSLRSVQRDWLRARVWLERALT
jgi:RNA polymerase sigma factor (TIGR02999 family)